jgi:GDP-mannose 6-dehydrogenase
MYPRLTASPVVTSFRVAETIKYADNAFHALKVAFANEVGAICKAVEVDGRAVMSLFAQDSKLNISPVYLKPGAPFGGSCLPKDLRALAHIAERAGVDAALIRAVLESNAAHKHRVWEMIRAHGRGRVAMLGLAFKTLTDDLRESPFVELAEMLIGKGYDLSIFDPIIRPTALLGSNLSYITRELPHLHRLLADSLERAVDGANIVILATSQPAFAGVRTLLKPDQTFIDLAGLTDRSPISDAKYEGICW